MGYDILSGTSSAGYDKELNVNAKYFRVKTFDGGRPIFEIQANSGSSGYDSTLGRFGSMSLSLKDIQGPGSIKMTIDGSFDEYKEVSGSEGIANIYFKDPGKDVTGDEKYLPININNMLRIYGENTISGGKTYMQKIKLTTMPTLDLNGAIYIERNGAANPTHATTPSNVALTYTNSPILAIKNSGENQELYMYDKDGQAIFSLWKSVGNIHLSPDKFSIGTTDASKKQTSSVSIIAKEINM